MRKEVYQYGLFIIFTIAANRLDDHLITPALPLLPGAPFILYSIVVYAVSILLLLGLVLALWAVCRWGWSNLTEENMRRDTWARIRAWPASKWDLFLALAMAYVAGIMVLMIATMVVLPRGRIAGTMSPEEFLNIFWVSFAPFLIVTLIFVGRSIFDTYKDLKRRWAIGTSKQKAILAAGVIAFMAILVLLVSGDIAGWDEMLFANSG